MAKNNKDIKPDPSEKNTANNDLQDSLRDRQHLEPDEAFIDLPDVKDIPGQEFIHVPRMGELEDTTISSDDEEGTGLFDDDEEDETAITMGTRTDIPRDEKIALESGDTSEFLEDDRSLQKAALDNADDEGQELNVSFDQTGEDLDVPGAEADDRDERSGGEDEENNNYSRGSDSNDNMTEGTP